MGFASVFLSFKHIVLDPGKYIVWFSKCIVCFHKKMNIFSSNVKQYAVLNSIATSYLLKLFD